MRSAFVRKSSVTGAGPGGSAFCMRPHAAPSLNDAPPWGQPAPQPARPTPNPTLPPPPPHTPTHAEPGTRPGLHGQTLVSMGLVDMDKLLGGGLPLGSLLLVLEVGLGPRPPGQLHPPCRASAHELQCQARGVEMGSGAGWAPAAPPCSAHAAPHNGGPVGPRLGGSDLTPHGPWAARCWCSRWAPAAPLLHTGAPPGAPPVLPSPRPQY
jgi:hypothetical protein